MSCNKNWLSLVAFIVIAEIYYAYTIIGTHVDYLPLSHVSSINMAESGGDSADSNPDSAKDCRKIQLSEKKLPLTYLTSNPGAGNTWVRHLLQQATGEIQDLEVGGFDT